jgi:hypothetical protein
MQLLRLELKPKLLGRLTNKAMASIFTRTCMPSNRNVDFAWLSILSKTALLEKHVKSASRLGKKPKVKRPVPISSPVNSRTLLLLASGLPIRIDEFKEFIWWINRHAHALSPPYASPVMIGLVGQKRE